MILILTHLILTIGLAGSCFVIGTASSDRLQFVYLPYAKLLYSCIALAAIIVGVGGTLGGLTLIPLTYCQPHVDTSYIRLFDFWVAFPILAMSLVTCCDCYKDAKGVFAAKSTENLIGFIFQLAVVAVFATAAIHAIRN